MAIRTGEELLQSLRDDRLLFIDGERVGDVTTDPRFAGNRARLEHRAELIRLIGDRIKMQPRQFWIAELTAAGVPCAPVNTIPDVLRDPQIAALGILQEVAGVTLTGLPISFDGVRPEIRALGPRLGQDNDRLGGGDFHEARRRI